MPPLNRPYIAASYQRIDQPPPFIGIIIPLTRLSEQQRSESLLIAIGLTQQIHQRYPLPEIIVLFAKCVETQVFLRLSLANDDSAFFERKHAIEDLITDYLQQVSSDTQVIGALRQINQPTAAPTNISRHLISEITLHQIKNELANHLIDQDRVFLSMQDAESFLCIEMEHQLLMRLPLADWSIAQLPNLMCLLKRVYIDGHRDGRLGLSQQLYQVIAGSDALPVTLSEPSSSVLPDQLCAEQSALVETLPPNTQQIIQDGMNKRYQQGQCHGQQVLRQWVCRQLLLFTDQTLYSPVECHPAVLPHVVKETPL